jgi:hypothetical protein
MSFMLSVTNKFIMLNVIMLNVIMLNVIMLNVIMLNAILLSVNMPTKHALNKGFYGTEGAVFTTLHFLRNLRIGPIT